MAADGKGPYVTVTFPAKMLREFDDGTARVDAGGIEIPVEADEWEYTDEEGPIYASEVAADGEEEA